MEGEVLKSVGPKNAYLLWAGMCLCAFLFGTVNSCAYAFTRVKGKSISACSPTEILEVTEDSFDGGDYDRAAHLASYIVEEFPDSKEAEDALYFAAEASFRADDLKEAFNRFKELMVRFPATRWSGVVAQRDFAIGKAYFEEGTGLFGPLKNRGYGVKVMNHLLAYFPTSDLADDAQLAVGLYYFSKEDFFTAAESFERLVDEYPTSEWAEKAVFLAGKSYFKINKGPSYDRESLLRCIQVLRSYRAKYPQGSFLAPCKEILSAACERMAAKELEIALFYMKQDQEIGARTHLANAVLLFPATAAGGKAARLLEERGWDTSVNSRDAIRPRRVMSVTGH